MEGLFMAEKNYHDKVIIDNEIKLRKLTSLLPRFCNQFFIGIEPTSSSRTRIAYAYDLHVFFNYIKDQNPNYKDIEIRDIPIDVLDKITATDIEEYLQYLKYYEMDGKEHMNNERGIMRKLASLRTFYNYFYRTNVL